MSTNNTFTSTAGYVVSMPKTTIGPGVCIQILAGSFDGSNRTMTLSPAGLDWSFAQMFPATGRGAVGTNNSSENFLLVNSLNSSGLIIPLHSNTTGQYDPVLVFTRNLTNNQDWILPIISRA